MDKLEDLLETFSLEELLEMNNLTETEVLCILFNQGLLHQPEHILEGD